jgi:uncharacterized protein YciI
MIIAARTTYTKDEAKVNAFRPAHREYLGELAAQKKLLLAGPTDIGGLLVFDVASKEEVEKLLGQDPFSIEKIMLSYELIPWDIKINAFLK